MKNVAVMASSSRAPRIALLSPREPSSSRRLELLALGSDGDDYGLGPPAPPAAAAAERFVLPLALPAASAQPEWVYWEEPNTDGWQYAVDSHGLAWYYNVATGERSAVSTGDATPTQKRRGLSIAGSPAPQPGGRMPPQRDPSFALSATVSPSFSVSVPPSPAGGSGVGADRIAMYTLQARVRELETQYSQLTFEKDRDLGALRQQLAAQIRSAEEDAQRSFEMKAAELEEDFTRRNAEEIELLEASFDMERRDAQVEFSREVERVREEARRELNDVLTQRGGGGGGGGGSGGGGGGGGSAGDVDGALEAQLRATIVRQQAEIAAVRATAAEQATALETAFDSQKRIIIAELNRTTCVFARRR